MFPYIKGGKQKKKNPAIGSQQMIKQWTQLKKQIDAKARLSLPKIKATNIADYIKVCRLKQVPDFYSTKASEEKAMSIIEKQTEQIISEQSNYHKIQRALTKRNQSIASLESILDIVQGLQSMNSGKSVTSSIRNIINQLLRQAKNLQEIKKVQNNQTIALAESIISVRKNTLVLMEEVNVWRNFINEINDAPSLKKIKVIFPYSHINCLLLPLYDLQFIFRSFLSKEYQINSQKNPFIIIGRDLRAKNEFHEIFTRQMQKDKQSYEDASKDIEKQIPKSEHEIRMLEQLQKEKIKQLIAIKEKQKQKQKEKEKKQKQRLKDKSQKQKQKEKNEKQIEKKQKENQKQKEKIKRDQQRLERSRSKEVRQKERQNQKQKLQKERQNQREKQKQKKEKQRDKQQKKEKSKASLYQKKPKKKKQKDSHKKNISILDIQKILLRGRKSKNSKIDGSKSQGSISNLSSIQKSIDKQVQDNNKGKDKKQIIKGIYSSKSNKNEKINKILNEKKDLERQLKQAKIRNIQYEKIFKKIDKESSIEQKKSPRRSINISEEISKSITDQNIQSPSKTSKKNISAIYSHVRKPKNKQLISKSFEGPQEVTGIINQKKLLQKQLKSQRIEKLKMERLLKKSQNQIAEQIKKKKNQKQKYAQQIQLLKSKVTEKVDSINIDRKAQKNNNRHNKSVEDLYLLGRKRPSIPDQNVASSRINQQKLARKDLQRQIKEILKEKVKLQKILERSEGKMTKEKQANERRIQKYQKVIEELKKQRSPRKKSAQLGPLKQQSRKKTESLRMYTTSPAEQKLSVSPQKSKKSKNISMSANFFKLPPQIKRMQHAKKQIKDTIAEQNQAQQSDKQKITDSTQIKVKKGRDVEIIQTKKTIEIIYESSRKRKNKQEKTKPIEQQPQKAKDAEFQKIKKQKQMLLYRIERQDARKKAEEKNRQRRLQNQDKRVQKYQQMIEKQRQKKYELQFKLKQLKRNLYDEYENRLKSQKMKFNEERKQLLSRIQSQKQQRMMKQKHISNQIRFLKQMQSNENQLIKLLQLEKKNRKNKQKQLAEEIAQKEQLMTMLEIQQIKKGIEVEIRQELEGRQDTEEQDEADIEERKQALKRQIQEMNDQRNMQLEQIDDQNQKLKALIQRIKQEQTKLVNAIKENIQQQSDQESQEDQDNNQSNENHEKNKNNQKNQDNEDDENNNKIENNEREKSLEKKNDQQDENSDIENIQKIFKSRLKVQEEHEKQMKQFYKNISESPTYKQKQQVENLIEKYLDNPHQYPKNQKIQLSSKEKQKMEYQVLKRSRQAGQFQRELLKLEKMQSFVPTAKDDIMTSHLLSLKKIYQKQSADALKNQLFPAIYKDQPGQNQLSFESEETPPPHTIRQHVQVHAKKFASKKKGNSKNFLAINKMRLARLEQNRKQKQQELIEQIAKKRSRSLKRRKSPFLKKKNQEDQQSKDLKQSNVSKKSTDRKKSSKKIEKQQGIKFRQKQDGSNDQQNNKKIQQNKNQTISQQSKQQTISEIQKKSSHTITEQKQSYSEHSHQNSEKQQSQKQQKQQKQEKLQKQQEQQNKDEQNAQQNNINTAQLTITNNHTSIFDQQKKLLSSQIKSYQDQIRSFISDQQQHFQIYQHYVNENQLNQYLHDLQDISSNQLKALNNNPTFIHDMNNVKAVLILIAKDRNTGVQVGISVFHKQFDEQFYVCDYMIAHNMRNFLNLIFNFSRYIFRFDKLLSKIQYYFDITKLEDQISIVHFIEFEEKCKRMGEVYIKVDADKLRKYVLRRNLFEQVEHKESESKPHEGKGLQFTLKVRFHSDYMKQKGYGFKNQKSPEFVAITTLVADYIRKDEQRLSIFRKNAQSDLSFRQLLLTTLMFQKKQIDVKGLSTAQINTQERLVITKKLFFQFNIEDNTHMMELSTFNISHSLAETAKRCTFDIDEKEVNYVIYSPQDPITKIQSSNSSQIGIFMGLIPKYKMLIVDASQFMSMNKVNPQVNVFFYVKHFIKNIADVRKQSHPRVFIPEIHEQKQFYLKQLSAAIKGNVFAEQDIKIGWQHPFSNSVIHTPTHKDLVIKKPFIIALMSANIERAIEGTPICASVIE